MGTRFLQFIPLFLIGQLLIGCTQTSFTSLKPPATVGARGDIIPPAPVGDPEYCLGDRSVASPFAGGSGTPQEPYEICNVAQLNRVRTNLSAHFVLKHHLDLNGLAFLPFDSFSGSFDGENHEIRNWTYPGDGSYSGSYVGLFSEVTGSLTNLRMTNVSVVSGKSAMGGMVGYLTNGTVENCATVSGSITSTGDINGNGSWAVGGLVGGISNNTSFLRKSWSGVNVDAGHSYGGGGLTAGLGVEFTIEDSYATGNVTGYWMVGGLTAGSGNGGSEVTLIRSYALGAVTQPPGGGGWGTWGTGGLIANASTCTATDSYWNTDATVDSACGNGLTLAQLKDQTSFGGWDFTTIWLVFPGATPSLR